LRRSTWACAAMTLVALAGTAVPASAAPPALDELIGSGHGTVFPVTGAAGTPLLARFQYGFTGGDHHLRSVAAMPLPQQSAVEVTFADENGDDNYGYRVSHERVDPAGIQQAAFHGTCAGQCTVPLFTRPAGDVVFVLTGFRFTYDNADHHLDQISVAENGSQLTTVFKDVNGDDRYTYDVSYAWVPRSRLGTVGEILGNVHAAGSVSRFVTSGEKVVRGFLMDNLGAGDAGDNHIRDLGVVANANTIEVRYGDDNPADSADWRYDVQYAVVL
jgi:hypothetical protein